MRSRKWPGFCPLGLRRSGMIEVEPPSTQNALDRVVNVLDRRENIPILDSLVEAVRGEEGGLKISSAAIVLDANVFLRIPSHKKSSDIIDYLVGVHKKPIVVPGQVIQEFWNNQLSAIDTVYKTVAKKHGEISKEVDKFGRLGIIGVDVISEALDSFKASNEHIFEPELTSRTLSFLEKLVECAIVPFAPREPFVNISSNRKRAKTPPGFKDDGDGDFLVWVDLLWGLLGAQADGKTFDCVILLSQDSKIDWSRGHVAHPVLSAELKAVLGTSFAIWTLDKFAAAISDAN